MAQLSLMHGRSRCCEKELVCSCPLFSEILSLSRSAINGILRFDHSVLGGRESYFVSRRALISIYRSLDIRSEGGCPQTIAIWCFVVVVRMEHLSSIRLHSLRIKLIFNF